MDDVALREGSYFCRDCFLLLKQHAANFEIPDARDHSTLHDGSAFIILDIAHPTWFLQSDLLCKSLFLEVSNCIIVSVREEVLDWRSCSDIVFQVRHEMCSVAFDLLVGGDSAEHDLSKFAAIKRAVRYASAIGIRSMKKG